MKFIHTSDLHLGVGLSIEKLLIQYGMMQYILSIVTKEKPDYFVIAGDVFDKQNYGEKEALIYRFTNQASSNPYAESEWIPLYLFLEFVKKAKELGCKILICNGNHDPKTWEKHLVSKFDRYTSFGNDTWCNSYYLDDTDNYGKYRFILFPLSDCNTQNAEEAIKDRLNSKALNIDASIRKIIIGHLYTDNKKSSGIRNELGNLWLVNPELFKEIDYVALGHRHINLSLSNTNIHYSGSPINCGYLKDVQDEKIDIEKVCNGYINVVEVKEKGNVFVDKKRLYGKELLCFIELSYNQFIDEDEWISRDLYRNKDGYACEMVYNWHKYLIKDRERSDLAIKRILGMELNR